MKTINIFRRLIVYLLCAVMIVTIVDLSFLIMETDAKTKTVLMHSYPVTEYERGIYYGFISDGTTEAKAAKQVVTWKQYTAMIGRMIKKYDKSKYAGWVKFTESANSKKMHRDGAVIALLYAAETVGLNTVNTCWNENMTDYDFGRFAEQSYPVFSIKKPPVKNVDPLNDDACMTRRMDASFIYVARRKSCITGCTLLMPDGTDWRVNQVFTLKEAVESVVRLYESDEDIAYDTAEFVLKHVMKTGSAKKLAAAADKRREEIRNSKTGITKSDTFVQGKTYTGTAYYVSNHGNDANDGMSEEGAIKTLDRLRQIELKFGDAVFFERGSIWYGADRINIDGVQGITFSAYGTGEKPRFYGSLENSAGKEKWTLYYHGSDGRKVWKYYKKMPDAGVAVFNNGAGYAKRAVAYWDGKNYKNVENYQLQGNYDIKKHLDNMQIFPDLQYPAKPFNKSAYFIRGNNGDWKDYVTGDLYMRCDKGNPGELYSEINISTPTVFIDGMPDYCTADNLALYYSTQTVAGGAEDGKADNHLIFQNCEAGYMGGGVYGYGEEFPSISLMGGGFNVNGSDEQIINCYTHHCYQEGPSIESFDDIDGLLANCKIENNLTEYCVMGNVITNWDAELKKTHVFKDLSYRNNMVLYSGFENLYTVKPIISKEGTSWADLAGYVNADSRAFGLITSPSGPNAYTGTFKVAGNTFAFSFGKLIEISSYSNKYSRVFSNNTYAQLPGFAWLSAYSDSKDPFTWLNRPREIDPEKAIKIKLKDTKANIIRFDI